MPPAWLTSSVPRPGSGWKLPPGPGPSPSIRGPAVPKVTRRRLSAERRCCCDRSSSRALDTEVGTAGMEACSQYMTKSTMCSTMTMSSSSVLRCMPGNHTVSRRLVTAVSAQPVMMPRTVRIWSTFAQTPILLERTPSGRARERQSL